MGLSQSELANKSDDNKKQLDRANKEHWSADKIANEKWINDNIDKVTTFIQNKLQLDINDVVVAGGRSVLIIYRDNCKIPGVNQDHSLACEGMGIVFEKFRSELYPLDSRKYIDLMRRIYNEKRLKPPNGARLEFINIYDEDDDCTCCCSTVVDIHLFARW